MAATNRELADFLRRARSQQDPQRTGLPADARVRRVPGLRREEVALLAGVSTDYYARLEQGRRIVPSPAVIDALARALNLDQAGRNHLEDLIGNGTAGSPRGRQTTTTPTVQRIRPGVQRLVDSLDTVPVLVLGRRGNVLAANRLARALFADFERMPARERNYARWILLDPDARNLFVDWDQQARTAVESLRLEYGADPNDRATTELIDELRAQSPEFDQWWNEHRVYQRTYGTKRLHHPVVGELSIDYETLTPPGDKETTVFLYSTEPNSSSQRALNLLASWSLRAPDAIH
ncbi:helix-turn-helix transcriptional regulator [Actinoplanes sp. NPDC049265]|uniref:helix-turn-helix transcriptional regulator n=1 Tax=Actinoplanes sp. NPDC049265 TaxID=3363902 RepID=UPI00370F8191